MNDPAKTKNTDVRFEMFSKLLSNLPVIVAQSVSNIVWNRTNTKRELERFIDAQIANGIPGSFINKYQDGKLDVNSDAPEAM
jgi:hypothetical protein